MLLPYSEVVYVKRTERTMVCFPAFPVLMKSIVTSVDLIVQYTVGGGASSRASKIASGRKRATARR